MKLNKGSIIVLLIILLMLVAAVAIISTGNAMRSIELSGLEYAVAAVDMGNTEALSTSPVSSIDQQLISPWAIDPGRWLW
jgi:uncharacterized membrane protein